MNAEITVALAVPFSVWGLSLLIGFGLCFQNQHQVQVLERIRQMCIATWVCNILVFGTCWSVYWSAMSYALCVITFAVSIHVQLQVNQKADITKSFMVKNALLLNWIGVLLCFNAGVAIYQARFYVVESYTSNSMLSISFVALSVLGFASAVGMILTAVFVMQLARFLDQIAVAVRRAEMEMHMAVTVAAAAETARVADEA